MRKPDRILSYHLIPATCGVAKFNKMLGERLDIPVYPLDWVEWGYPLISIKPEELSFGDECDLIDKLHTWDGYQLFLHSYDQGLPRSLINKADVVYAANAKIAKDIASRNVIQAWCPSLLETRNPFQSTDIRIFSFGMAHKIMVPYYKKLDDMMKATGKTYSLYLSTAIHEGMEFEDAVTGVLDEIEEVFTGRIYFLGWLSDHAIAHYLCNSHYFAAFFPGGVRENNTSVNAALELGVSVITNVDNHSPGYEVIDHNGIPIYKDASRGWDELINLMEEKNETADYTNLPCADISIG